MGKEAEKVTRTGTLHFSVSGEFITRISRNLWAEGAASKAIRLLKTGLVGMTEAIALDIVTGKKKLDGWNSKIRLRSDNATKDSRGLPLPRSLEEVLSLKDRTIEKIEKENRELAEHGSRLVEQIEHVALTPRTRIYTERTPTGAVARFRATPNDLLDDVKEIVGPDDEGTPEPTTDWVTWRSGWLSTDGKFYGCVYAGHVRLAHRLGFDDGRPEDRGWIKYQRQDWILYKAKVTQKQIDTLGDWSVATGKPIPPHILENEVE
jgi:hypothetical protein